MNQLAIGLLPDSIAGIFLTELILSLFRVPTSLRRCRSHRDRLPIPLNSTAMRVGPPSATMREDTERTK